MPRIYPEAVWLVTNIPTPYRIPLFNELRRQMSALGLQLKVIFASTGYSRRRWTIRPEDFAFEYSVLASRPIEMAGHESASFLYTGLLRRLRRERPALVIVAGFSPATAKLLVARWLFGVPYVIWSGDISIGGSLPASGLRTLFRRILVRGAKGFVAYGNLARQYLVALGAPADRIHVAINTVDTEFFREETARIRRSTKPPEHHKIICIGDLTVRKRAHLAIEAAGALATRRRDFILYLIGDGPERERLEMRVRELGIEPLVRFEGFRQKQEIPAYLAHASAFLFPTGFDIWGLVLPEAMAAGIPCLSSGYAGATADLIRNGETGYAESFDDPDSIARRLDWLMENPAEATAVGERASRFIREHANLSVSAQGIVQAICAGTGRVSGGPDQIAAGSQS